MRVVLFAVALSLFATLNVFAGLLPSAQPYVEAGGSVTGQAENYHALSSAVNGDAWVEAPTTAVVPPGTTYENASGGLFMQAQPDNGSPNTVAWGAAPYIDYFIQISTPGTYRLYLRWDGHSGDSDSIYAGFTDFAGPVNTNPDYWVDSSVANSHITSDFGVHGWDGLGEAENNTGAAAQNAMTFTIPVGGTGIFTLRVAAREDGVAFDSFRIQLASLPDPNPSGVAGQNVIIGSDNFSYANGSISNRTGGVNWDFDNTTNGDGFVGYTRVLPASTWDTVFGSPIVTTSTLRTSDSAAKREFGNVSEGDGSVNEAGGTRYRQVYYRVRMTRAVGATWSGISAYDFNTERIFFGVDFNPPVVGGQRHFAVGENGVSYTNVPAVDGTEYTLVAKVDFVNDQISLWVNPDLTQPEGAPAVTRTYLGDNWNSAIRLGSGGTGQTTWDDVAVGTSWAAIQRAYPTTTAASGPHQVIAVENFDYPDGNILGQDGGLGFDFDNNNTGGGFVGKTQTVSNWDNVDGWPYIFSNRLATWGTSAKREYDSPEADGSFSNAAASQYKTIYYRFEMQRSASTVEWSGLSIYDGNAERLMFGVPFATNPNSSRRELGIHNLGANQWSFTGVPPVVGTKYQIVGKIDYAAGTASLFINPNFSAGEPTPNATIAFTNATTALRFGSGGGAPTYWDKLIVGTSWTAIQGFSYPVATVASGSDLVIGSETFNYANGPIALRKGGVRWDLQNTVPPAFSNDASDWDPAFGSPTIAGNSLSTQESGAVRQFNGVEAEGAINEDATSRFKAVYVSYQITRSAGAAWSGVSLFDFGTERMLFGVPFATNPVSGVREFAIHDLNANQHSFSGIAPVNGQTYTVVAKLDFSANVATLWVNPNLDLNEASNIPAATRPYAGDNWMTAIRLASGGTAATTWDNLSVGTSWRSIQSAFSPPTAFADSITLRPNKKVLLDVFRNDAGAGSIELVSPPTHGTASIDSAGRVFYSHTTGSPTTDSLTYRILGINGQYSAPVTVTFNFSNALRIANQTSVVPLTAPTTGLAVVDSTPGLTFNAPSCMSAVPGNTDKVLVGERNGKIWLIPNIHSANPTRQLFLDVAAVVNPRSTEDFEDDGNELGLKGLALHPNFATNRQFFITYNFLISGQRYARVSRFTAVNGNLDLGDTASEQPFITQINPSAIHNIDSCRFGPDGYFYWASGDAGGLNDGNLNSQRIDKDFWAGIFRIDVDRQSANLEPTAHPSIVLNGSTAYYKVPANNPFVGATMFNGLALTGNVRTEIFAIGFRNPWQFSFDPQNGEMWAGEVGLDLWEEVNVVTPGGNYGWGYLEGNAVGARTNPPVGFAPTAPLWTYFHGGGALEGRSVTGGLVYRGTKYPTLTGKYVFGDFVSGHIWTLQRNGSNPPTVERITGEAGTVAFMLDPDPANGDILLLDYGDGKVRRIISQTVDTTYPTKLSDTGLFADLTDLSFNPGIERYDINLPFWSDYAKKSRWFMLPNDTSTFGYVQDGNWDLPTGAVWIKHFDMELTRGNPTTGKRLETRLLVKNATGSYGVSYRWNEAGTEAYLVDDGGEDFDMTVTISTVPTNVHWRIPSRSECLACHTPAGGHGLSFETRQLNRTGSLGGSTGNYLELMAQAGYLSNAPTQFHSLPNFASLSDTTQTLETRARSWLAVNCSYCHQAGGTAPGVFDLRSELSLTQANLIGTHVAVELAPTHRALVRGDALASIIRNRSAASGGYTRMPPLATAVIDPEGVQVLTDWINASAARQTYAEWRLAEFGSGSSPAGVPTNDADGDGISNQDEYLTLTNPEDSASRLTPAVSVSSGNVAVQFPNLQGRLIKVQTSTDLLNWSTWQLPGNNGLPANSGSTRTLIAPLDTERRFFRLDVQEQ